MKKEIADMRRARAQSLAAALTTVETGDIEAAEALQIGFWDGKAYPVVSKLAICQELLRIYDYHVTKED